jgi:hypothetical protein
MSGLASGHELLLVRGIIYEVRRVQIATSDSTSVKPRIEPNPGLVHESLTYSRLLFSYPGQAGLKSWLNSVEAYNHNMEGEQ